MSANLLDLFTAQPSARETAIVESAFRPERRRRARTQVHWPLLLVPQHGAGPIETITENLSSAGFYCFCRTPLVPGEQLVCTIKVPAFDPRSEQRTLLLECTVVVMRSEALPDGMFGTAVRIDDYRMVPER